VIHLYIFLIQFNCQQETFLINFFHFFRAGYLGILDLPYSTPKFDFNDFENIRSLHSVLKPLEDPVLTAKKKAEAKAKKQANNVEVCLMNMNLNRDLGK